MRGLYVCIGCAVAGVLSSCLKINIQNILVMEIWHIWILAALLLFIVEMFTTGFAVLCLAVGCVGGAIAAACDLSLEWQLIIFALVSFVALAAVRPILKRSFYRDGEKVPTNVNAMVGRRGVVCKAIDSTDSGRVVIDGVDWKAHSVDDMPVAEGAQVEVVAVDSVILTVKKL